MTEKSPDSISILLEGRSHNIYSYPDILVSQERQYQGKDWNEAQELLHKEQEFMLTPRQFIDLITLLKSGNAYDGTGTKLHQPQINTILDDLLMVRAPWRSEWLDAQFKIEKKSKTITYHTITPQGLQQVTEPLEDGLMKDKIPGIDLEDWLQRATPQGLPPKNVKEGSLYYWHPGNGTVAGFDAFSVRADFDCNWSPRGSYSAHGVRSIIRGEIK
mgnify:CR=1 FL=1